jgi:hypothetical protein
VKRPDARLLHEPRRGRETAFRKVGGGGVRAPGRWCRRAVRRTGDVSRETELRAGDPLSLDSRAKPSEQAPN